MIDRIAILGGSSVYIPELFQSVISHNLNVNEIVLFGLPGRKLEIVSAFCKRIVRKSGFPVEVIATDDLGEAVKGAKYILNHMRVGGMRARIRDEMLPPKFEMIGNEALGAGAFSNAMRALPVIFDYVKQIEAINPKATLINLTNPMGIVMEGLCRYSSLRSVGVCDIPAQYVQRISELLGKDSSELKVDYVGLDQLGWIQDVRVERRSRMSKLLDLIESEKDDGFDTGLIQLFRMIPTSHFGHFFHRAEIVKKQKSGNRFRAEVLYEAESEILKLYEDKHLDQVPELTRQRNAVWYDKAIIPLIQAFENDKVSNIILCVKNENSVRDLPEDSSVEVETSVSRRGAKPQKVGSLPRFLKGLFFALKESDRLVVEAVKHKSYEFALQSLAINPFVPSLETARRYLDRVINEDQLELH